MKMDGRQLWRAKPALVEKYNLNMPPTPPAGAAVGTSPAAQGGTRAFLSFFWGLPYMLLSDALSIVVHC